MSLVRRRPALIPIPPGFSKIKCDRLLLYPGASVVKEPRTTTSQKLEKAE